MHLCNAPYCRLPSGHDGECNARPISAWAFLQGKDKNKLQKAGYATPRGGKKGAYQNHVYRHSKVIIPYERIDQAPLEQYEDGYVVRLLPDQCFSSPGQIRNEVVTDDRFTIGVDAFVLYRSHESFERLPPPENWEVRHLENKNGERVKARGKTVVDRGHYVLRLPPSGGSGYVSQKERIEGPPQGIFAPEYADRDTDYLCQVALAWQIVHSVSSPYSTTQAEHLRAILSSIGQSDYSFYQYWGMMKSVFTTCPLCTRPLYYSEMHETLRLEDESGLLNAGVQVEGTTRSTVVNLFHMHPLVYEALEHIPNNVSWGHASCNTKLGQRRCYSLSELQELDLKAAVVDGESVSTFGWMSEDLRFIRSPAGGVWIKITEDTDWYEYPWLNESHEKADSIAY